MVSVGPSGGIRSGKSTVESNRLLSDSWELDRDVCEDRRVKTLL